jgi:predicted nucleic-acid-binding protein
MKRIVVDTNAWLRFFLNDIPEQKNSVVTLLRQAKESEIILLVPQIVIFELHFILDTYYHHSKSEIISVLKPLVSSEYIELESKEAFVATFSFYSSASSLSFVDCFLLAKSQLENAELFTFNKQLKKASVQ